MKKGLKMLSIISSLATIGSLILDLIGGWADDKKIEETIEQKVQEAMENRQALPEPYTSTEIGFANNIEES